MRAGSAYIRWAKSRESFRYNLGRSSIQPCPPDLLRHEGALALNGANAHGWPPLREALAERYGVDYEQVVLAVGASMANHLVCATLLRPGDHVVLESPGYEPLAALVRQLGCGVERFARTSECGWRLDAEAVEERIEPETRLVIVSDLHNPSGQRATPEALDRLGELAERHDLHVLVDEVYREFVDEPPSGLAASRHPRLVSTCSLTKAYGLDGVRAGWIVTSPELADRIRDMNDLYGIIMPHPTEQLALRALAELKSIRAWVDGFLLPNRARLHEFVSAHPALAFHPPAYGPIAFVQVEGIGVDALVERLERRHDTTAPAGRHFGVDDHLRLACGMSPEDLTEGLERLAAALDEMGRDDARGGTR